jgi:hypothetical protein
MRPLSVNIWRACFVFSAILLLAGGPRHPRGTMAEMLQHPNWGPAHALMLAGFAFLGLGLHLYGRQLADAVRTLRWLHWALLATVLQAVEMGVHTAASADAANLVAGRATPILSTHLGLSVVAYPIFGLTLAGLIVAGARDRVLGAPWTAGIGVIGALAHGAAPPLTVGFQLGWARLLFPLLVLFALWLLLAGLWPTSRKQDTTTVRDSAA